MDIDKICRCCLTNEGPLLTIYDDGATNKNKNTLADMIKEIAKVKPDPNDKLPDKACLTCVRDINQCFTFKLKCESSYRALRQLFCSVAKVELQNPFKNLQSSINITPAQMPPVDSINYTHNYVLEHNGSDITKEETNPGCSIPKTCPYKDAAAPSSAENCISVPSSPISFRICSPIQTTQTHLNSNDIDDAGEITDNQQEFTDTDTNDSYDLEFISENPEIHEPIVILDDEQDVIYNTTNVKNQVVEVDAPEVEFTFQNVSSPQWIGEDRSFLNSVNEDLRLENVQTMNNMEKLKEEERQTDDAGYRYQCAICAKEFIDKMEFNNHFDTHERPYSCLHCNILFDDYLALQMHLLKHTNNSTTAPMHSKKTLSVSNLKTPTKKPQRPRKRIREKRFTCEFCQMKFYTGCVLANHRRIHTGEKPYKCSYCDKSFIQSSTRSNHEKIHTGEKRFKCQYCDKTFIQSGTRASHEMTHTGVKRFKCRFCYKRFIQQGVLQAHETTHTKERPYKCNICYKGFSKQGVQQKHEAYHGSDDIKCSHCDLWFVNSVDVKEHMMVFHAILNPYPDTVTVKAAVL